ncbi:unnamed protein product [Orchesella dallaii]|uniref:Calcineurin-like phosphoesterase domain-containing protein n=1 Tax=Orchesella dallaii TaxID=48710 RepID=A0ABP1QAT9_9HEXA
MFHSLGLSIISIMLSVLCIFLAVSTCCNSGSHSRLRASVPIPNKAQPLVRFNVNGKLKIVQFADLHYGEAPDTDWGPAADIKSRRVIEDALQWENPDFVIFTGDQVTGELMYPNGTDYIHILLTPFVEKGYRWASVYGNHDIGPNLTRLEILQAEQSYGDLCYTKQVRTDLPGVTNYFIPIYAAENDTIEEEQPVMIWWFFDSQGGRNQFGQQPHYIDQNVVEWFRNESQRLRSEWGMLPSLVFFHIPPQEYVTIQDNVLTNQLCDGLLDDDVTPQDNNTGIMEALSEAGGVKTIFVGHDHGNAWCCFYKDIEVCYNRHTGYGGYGTWTRGVRVIDLDIRNLENRTNYVRLETGEVVDNFPRKNVSLRT